MKYNPQLSEFLKTKKDITVIGLFWAGFWRLYAIVLGIAIVVAILAEL
jgi:hypothetical protein